MTTQPNSLWTGMKAATNVTETENGAKTFKSTSNPILDLFSMGGALRSRASADIQQLVSLALSEDKDLALRCLFYLRDIRGGQGERRTFREALKVVSNFYPNDTAKILSLVPEYGRWDDILHLENVDIKKFLLDQLAKDVVSEHPSLLAKWLPSENAGKKSKALAKKLRKYLGFSSKEYRGILSKLRSRIGLLETKMSTNNWRAINYEQVPSQASVKFRKAFSRNDADRYVAYLESVKKGEKVMKTGTLFPYEIVEKYMNTMHTNEVDNTLEMAWKNLPNYVKLQDRAIVVTDTSGSMSGRPISIAISLAMYFAERNIGQFQNKFITFSANPELQEVRGATLKQKILNLSRAHWDMNTNLQAVFDLVLDTAVHNKVPESDMPQTIYIVSDMEFDACTNGRHTNLDSIREKYERAGYKMPKLVFWNVDSRQNNVPAKENDRGVALVSGSSPSTFRFVVEGTTPQEFMLEVLNSERYSKISAALNS